MISVRKTSSKPSGDCFPHRFLYDVLRGHATTARHPDGVFTE